MQANCPKCANNIVIDDARVPERAFSVKCPKCQTSVRFPGKGAATAAAPAATPMPVPSRAAAPPRPSPAPEAPRSDAGPDGSTDAVRAEMMAQVRREMSAGSTGSTPAAAAAGRALVSVADRAQGGALTAALGRAGYQVENLDNPDEGARLIDQGVYDLVVTTRADAGGGRESLYQRMARLSPDTRRRVFLVVVGEDLKTGDGTQAWIALADLVAHPKDLATLDAVLTKTVQERRRLYQAYIDARKRFEASAV